MNEQERGWEWEVLRQLAQVKGFVRAGLYELLIIRQELHHMADELASLQAQVAANTSAEASAVQLLQNLHDLIVNAGTDPAALKAITDTLKQSGDALAAAVVANTPAAP